LNCKIRVFLPTGDFSISNAMKELVLINCRLDNRFDIQNLLGRGSYAEIYVARDILAPPGAPHSHVVIKALNVFMQGDLDADLERTLVENFQNEAVALDRVRHPNIISRLGHGTAKDLIGTVFHYLVLEYLPGGDLARACPKQGLPLDKAFDYLEQVCAGLAHAHKCGVIHRDIKPQNLLLTQDRKTVKIADFGVARMSASDSPITRVGTNMYAPPEHSPVFSNEEGVVFSQLTPAADIYSLAKAAYVLVTGESPRRFSHAPISDLPAAFSDKPWANSLLLVLKKATQNNPQERHQNVNDLWEDLVQVKLLSETESVEPRPAEPIHITPQPSYSHGFSPDAPVKPKFNTSRDLKFKEGTLEQTSPRLVIKLNEENGGESNLKSVNAGNGKTDSIIVPIPSKPKKKFLPRAATFALLLTLFALALFATQNYLRNQRILPEIQNPFKPLPEGVVQIDLNLRPAPGTDNQPIGLVPKNSRVRIVNTKDNWYEVIIIEFSRPKDNPNYADRGWVSGRFIEVKEQ
jgi:serine/threonine protein kinase